MKKEHLIQMPSHSPVKRFPGKYHDLPSYNKKRNNYMILHSCKLLQSFYKVNGINALILDGQEMRTTKALMKLGHRLNKLDIVECNKDTFNIMKASKKDKKINIYFYHLKNFLEYNKCDPYTNLFYLDAMCSLFSSEYSFGSDLLINEFLKKSKCDEIILGITICLRDGANLSFTIKEKKIMILLDKIFCANGFDYTNLTGDNNFSRYKGQRMNTKSMVFYLFFLKRI